MTRDTRQPRRLVLAVLTIAAIAWAALADPAHGHHYGRARAVANHTWGSPCGGRAQLGRADLGDGIIAVAYIAECRMVLNTRWAELERPANWPTFCTVVLHEMGHLARWRAPTGSAFRRPDGSLDTHHSANPRSVMYPALVDVDERCERAGRAKASAAGGRL